MLADPGSLDFTPFHIFGADGQQYTGIRPSVIPKPFKNAVVILNGKAFKPGLPPGCSLDQVLGYGACVRVGINIGPSVKQSKEDRAYRLITFMEDGKRWSKLIYMNGYIEEDWF